jgi:hypothetical protein
LERKIVAFLFLAAQSAFDEVIATATMMDWNYTALVLQFSSKQKTRFKLNRVHY